MILKITSELIAEFAGEVIGQRGSQTPHEHIGLDVVVAPAGNAVVINRNSLNAVGRAPAHTVVAGGKGILAVDDPVHLWKQNVLIAGARNHAGLGQQKILGGAVIALDLALHGRRNVVATGAAAKSQILGNRVQVGP